MVGEQRADHAGPRAAGAAVQGLERPALGRRATARCSRSPASVLGDGKSSRLYKRLVYKDRIATDVDAFIDDREIASQLLLMVTAQPGGDLAEVERALDEELKPFLASGPTAAELDRVKTQTARGSSAASSGSAASAGSRDILAQGQVFAATRRRTSRSRAAVASATPADVQGAARRVAVGRRVRARGAARSPSTETVASSVDRKQAAADSVRRRRRQLPAPSAPRCRTG